MICSPFLSAKDVLLKEYAAYSAGTLSAGRACA